MRTTIHRSIVASLSLVTVALAAGCSGAAPVDENQALTEQALGAPNGEARVCADVAAGQVRCHAHVLLGADGKPLVSHPERGGGGGGGTPAGYGPAQLQAAYGLAAAAAANGAGVTVAVVDAYDYPSAESDLAVYRAQYGLPPCTSASGCFKKVDQNGGTTYPRSSSGWATEEALDVDMVSAICPKCNIVLVEANSAQQSDLDIAVDTGARLANAVSNSYGGAENASSANDTHYSHPGVSITASSGDNGYGVEFPASSQYVTAVGGTSLHASGGTYTETAWSGAGSGCSAYVAKPSWQTDTGCANRTVADVSAVADPNTGVAVYETFNRRGGWQVYGGTSVASPIIASVYALGGAGVADGTPYAHTSALHDVTSGSNGSCAGSYLCTSGAGYDGPTGLGTPNGVGAF